MATRHHGTGRFASKGRQSSTGHRVAAASVPKPSAANAKFNKQTTPRVKLTPSQAGALQQQGRKTF